jgi:hypothetical protein
MAPESIRVRRTAGVVLLVAGSILLLVSLIGDHSAAGRYADYPPRGWERFDPAMASRTPDLRSLFREAEARGGAPLRDLPPPRAMELLDGVVMDRFTHGDRATYNPFSNWILWAIGVASPRHSYIQDPEALLRNGHSAMCGEISFVLLRLGDMAGIRVRLVHLNGHMVMEAWYGGDWHAYDPDLEAIVRDEMGNVLSVKKAARRPDLLRRSYAGRGTPEYVDRILAIYTDTDDDGYLPYPPVGYFDPLGHWPGRVEQAAIMARSPLPILLLAAGFALLLAGRRWNRDRG